MHEWSNHPHFPDGLQAYGHIARLFPGVTALTPSIKWEITTPFASLARTRGSDSIEKKTRRWRDFFAGLYTGPPFIISSGCERQGLEEVAGFFFSVGGAMASVSWRNRYQASPIRSCRASALILRPRALGT